MLIKTCPQDPYTDCMCSWSSFSCCSDGGFEGERGGGCGDCLRSVRCGVRGEGRDCCTGDDMKGSWRPGWGWLCVCATCINCCGGCPMLLVILTVLSSCWKGSISMWAGFIWSGSGACISMVARFKPRRSRLMPDRCCRCCRVLAGSGRTRGASKAAGVEFCRRCCVRRRWMLELEGAVVDSILYAGRVRMSLSRRRGFLYGPNLTQCKRRPPGGWYPYGFLSTDAVSRPASSK